MNNLLKNMLNKKNAITNRYGKNLNIDSIIIEEDEKVFSHFYKNDNLHEMRSISKVMIALAYGILLDRRKVSLNDYIYPVIKDIIAVKNSSNLYKIKKWQIKHLLTYSCGFEKQMFSERFIEGIEPKDYLNYIVNYELAYEPGERYVYNNADIFLLSVYFQELYKENIKDFIEMEIFHKLGIKNFEWANYDKYCPGGTGLYLTHKDMFKIGQLILDYGKYKNEQIVSSEYIKEMCSTKIETPYAVNPERVLPKLGVGYVMHISRDGYAFKDGANGQYLIVNFKKRQLITILSSESDMSCVTEILRNLI